MMHAFYLLFFAAILCSGCAEKAPLQPKILVYDMHGVEGLADGSARLTQPVATIQDPIVLREFKRVENATRPDKSTKQPQPTPNGNWIVLVGRREDNSEELALWLFADGEVLWRYGPLRRIGDAAVLPPKPVSGGGAHFLAKLVAEKLRKTAPSTLTPYDLLHDADVFGPKGTARTL